MSKRLREPVNGFTHLVGGLLAFAGLLVLLATAMSMERVDQFVAFGIFGCSLVALYTTSALYHLLPLSPAGVARMRRVDHMMIFVLIAGCYTPVCLLTLEGSWRWELLGVVWVLALCGVLLKLLWMGGTRWFSVMLYLGMGWLIVIIVPDLFQTIGLEGIAWGVAGGLIYSVGALIYVLKRPNPLPGVLGFHELWHLFVIAGSACHFWVMLGYIAPLM